MNNVYKNSVLLLLAWFSFVALGQVQQVNFNSKVLRQDRPIQIVLPERYNANSGKHYPVLYVLDGEQQLPHSQGIAKGLSVYGEMPELILVAIDSINRTNDLTPNPFPGVARSGKAEVFLRFITEELQPYINSRYRTNDYKMIAGHSLGGLFVTYSLIEAPNAFNARFAFSPSLRFLNEEQFSKLQQRLINAQGNPSFYYMNIGAENAKSRKAFERVEAMLSKASNQMQVKADYMKDETHFTTPILGQALAFRALFRDWKLTLDIAEGGLASINRFYRRLSERLGVEVKPEASQLNSVAYEVWRVKGKSELANEIFSLAMALYPTSPEAYVGKGRVLNAQGEKASAVTLIEQALSLTDEKDDRYASFQRRLARIKAQ